jgi:DNA-binding CsgD family transcriptional regulator
MILELADAFGITNAEAKIVGFLVEGRSITETGAILGISANTARTHLKHIFAKMQCTRQSDLIRQVTRHPIWVMDLE